MAIAETFPVLGLVALRICPVLLAVGMGPLQRVPMMVRLVLLVVFSITTTFLLSPDTSLRLEKNLLWVVLCELVIGVCIFFTLQVIFAAISFWGRVVDMQIGFGAAGIFDPSVNTQESITGSIYIMAATALFFLLGIHIEFIKVILVSYNTIPLGSHLLLIPPVHLASLITAIFSTVLLIFAPVILLLWLLDIFTGFISRTMPQMNIYFVMMPLKIGSGLFLLSVFSKQSLGLFNSLLNSLVYYWSNFF
ncbi:flagellar biosynthetic protein FliR [Rheinheimera aquimaris]|jgi:flagellar biosynthetic protein FliR|uniref:flagellar biosynthetic protein FliR n=1 Tax=Rheinheimera aquimaris TaxID=412437 RepID=UPI001E620A4F|nr:flagellar biosynthetic protein FliR [Rheinheimera aquimaris]MCD1600368.1 flagellar biosynthetic protein FliR [Rheinheimera aquimaris]